MDNNRNQWPELIARKVTKFTKHTQRTHTHTPIRWSSRGLRLPASNFHGHRRARTHYTFIYLLAESVENAHDTIWRLLYTKMSVVHHHHDHTHKWHNPILFALGSFFFLEWCFRRVFCHQHRAGSTEIRRVSRSSGNCVPERSAGCGAAVCLLVGTRWRTVFCVLNWRRRTLYRFLHARTHTHTHLCWILSLQWCQHFMLNYNLLIYFLLSLNIHKTHLYH